MSQSQRSKRAARRASQDKRGVPPVSEAASAAARAAVRAAGVEAAAQSSGQPGLGDRLAGKYLLERVLGEGGMSVVYAAVNTATGKHVAIKWLRLEAAKNEEYTQQLLREARATSAIDHPNVVNLYDVDRHGGSIFLVMEMLHGEPLSAALRRGPLSPSVLVQLMVPVLRGVHAAHRVGVVHRDLKPDNLFLCRDPFGGEREPKVLDFGISKPISSLLDQADEPEPDGVIFGTPHYMAPEQLRDVHFADPRSDIYALGVIMYRALSLAYPFDGESLRELAQRIVAGGATPLHTLCPQIDPRLCDVVMRAIALEPSERPQTAAALAEELEPFAHDLRGTTALARDSAPALQADAGPLGGTPPPLPGQTGVQAIGTLPPAAIAARTEPRARLTPRQQGAWALAVTMVVLGVIASAGWLGGDTPAKRDAPVASSPGHAVPTGVAPVPPPQKALPATAAQSLPPQQSVLPLAAPLQPAETETQAADVPAAPRPVDQPSSGQVVGEQAAAAPSADPVAKPIPARPRARAPRPAILVESNPYLRR